MTDRKIPPTIHGSKIDILMLFKNGNQYTVKEVQKKMEFVGYATAHEHMNTLIKDGYLVQTNNRKWRISKAGRTLLKAVEEGKAIVEKPDHSKKGND